MKVLHARLGLCASVLVCIVVGGCGSPSEPSGPSYPSITGSYGGMAAAGASGNAPATFNITYRTSAGGESRVDLVGVIIVVTQDGPTWSGRLERRTGNYSVERGTMEGTLEMSGAIQFRLTQARWGDCTGNATLAYAGTAREGAFQASGGGTIHCEDGTSLEVQESMHGRIPEPPPPPVV